MKPEGHRESQEKEDMYSSSAKSIDEKERSKQAEIVKKSTLKSWNKSKKHFKSNLLTKRNNLKKARIIMKES